LAILPAEPVYWRATPQELSPCLLICHGYP
jgi:hypothetical protein